MRSFVDRLSSFAAPSDRWIAAIGCAGAAIGLGYALQISNGTIHPEAITLLIVALVLAGISVAHPRLGLVERWGEPTAVAVLGAGLILGVFVHLTTSPGSYLQVGPDGYVRHHQWVAAMAVLAGAGLSKTPWLGPARTMLFLAVGFLLGLWLLSASPNPTIDVFVWHREAYEAVRHGVSPYAITIPNIYGRTEWYAPGLADATRVFVGYPYPPLTLALGAFGQLAANDYRYANLGALILSAGLIAFSRPGRIAPAAAAILLLSPRSLFVLEQGWTESTAILAFSVTVFCACRTPRVLPWAFGAMLATKQYFVLCAPLAFLLMPPPLTLRSAIAFAWRAMLVPVVLTLPFVLWSPKAFFDSVVLFQVLQPYRADSLSFLAWTMVNGVPRIPLWAGFAALIPAYLLALFRAPRTPFGFAAASGLMFLMFFAFSKQAFCNYYFLIVGVLCAAVGAANPAPAAEAAKPASIEAAPTAGVEPISASTAGSETQIALS